tara:strand:+ start:4630 stop:4764 length:135 start_codon:yes stop_codon:yes gene_type:complete
MLIGLTYRLIHYILVLDGKEKTAQELVDQDTSPWIEKMNSLQFA